MFRFFYKVHQNEIEQIASNCFDLKAPRIDCFGFAPRFHLDGFPCVFVVEAEPKNGIWGEIMKCLFPWKEKNPKEEKVWQYTESNDETKIIKDYRDPSVPYSLYSLKTQFGWNIRGCVIHVTRTDEFTEILRTNDSYNHYEFTYIADIEAMVDAVRFYKFLKIRDNANRLLTTIDNRLLAKIDTAYHENNDDADFRIDDFRFNDPVLDEAGYTITNCSICYTQQKK